MFENISALFLLVFLLPVIILYLLKPRPKVIRIPSLMLLIPALRKKKLRSFFKKLIRDPLLFIQLIAITVLVIGLANPFLLGTARYDHTIIVLDVSASMSSTDVSPDRFTKAVDIAKDYISDSGKITLILAGNEPVLFFKDMDSLKAMNDIDQLEPKATGTNLNDAILLAVELMKNDNGKLVVISDFSGQEITRVSRIIEGKEIPVDYRQVGVNGSNMGIVDATIEKTDLKFIVKNYDDIPKNVLIKVIHGDNVELIQRTIKQNSRDFFFVQDINSGTSRIVLEPADDLLIDNTLFISMPEITSRKILLLSGSKDRLSPVNIAFNSIPGLDIQQLSFEQAPREMDYGLVVVYDYTKNSLLPGTSGDLRKYVEEGGTLVIVAASDLQFMDIKDLVPVNVAGIARSSRIETRKTELTADIDFGTSGYLNGELKKGAVELASAQEVPVLAYWNIGNGKVMYLGINDIWGDFHLQTSYPVFWYRVLESVNPSAEELNLLTGAFLPPGIGKPGSTIDNIYLDRTGFYEIGEKTIAMNLLDEKESNILINKIDLEGQDIISGTRTEKKHLNWIFAFLAIILIALELYYLRYRGDI